MYLFEENPKELKWWNWEPDEDKENFVVPNNFTVISRFSFHNAEQIKKLYLHEKVEKIDGGTFEFFTNIETIEVHPNNKTFYVEDGILFKKTKIKGKSVVQLELYPAGKTGESYTIPDNVASLGRSAFVNAKHLKKITISDNLIPTEWRFMGFSDTIEEVILPSITPYVVTRKKTDIYPSKHIKTEKGYSKIYEEDNCIFCLSESLFPASRYRPTFDKVLLQWNKMGGRELSVFYETLKLPDKLLDDSKKFDAIIYPKFPLYWRSDHSENLKVKNIVPLVFPRIDFRKIKDLDTKFSLLLGYLAHPEFYNDESLLSSGWYKQFAISQKQKILPYIFKIDRPDLLKFYAERNCITIKNIDMVYLNPAIESGAIKCVEYLKQFQDEFLMSKKNTEDMICEENGITYAVSISTKANTFLHKKRCLKCDKSVSGDVYLPFNVVSIEKDAFDGCENITAIVAPKFEDEEFDYAFNDDATIPLVFPMVDFNSVKNKIIKTNLLLGYLAHPEYYEDCITGGFQENTLGENYLEYVIEQKKKMLPYIFKLDRADMVEFYALRGRITSQNFEKDFLNPAKEANAEKCIDFLKCWGEAYL